MTVSMFDAYLQRMYLHKVERIMDISQATLYAQLPNEPRRKMWNNWNNFITSINNRMIFNTARSQGKNPITWNGQVVSIRQLVRRFATTFGKGEVQN